MTSTVAAGYTLDSAWHAERERLSSITSLYDPQTMRCADRLGLSEAWRCLDVGAGTGSVAELLAERVGESGRVLAVDVDVRFLEPLTRPPLEVLRADVRSGELPGGFDLVHARLVLEHLPEREAVLDSMVRATAPGGWVLVEDFDWSTAVAVDPPSGLHEKVVHAIRTFFSLHGYDAQLGRRLPRLLQAAGLVDVAADSVSVQVQANRERGVPQWELLVEQLAPGMIAADLLDEQDVAAFHALWHDGDTVSFAPLMVSAWGRKP
ncbi:MAG TPA: methyltransferase domain-containing protein [Thermoleophilaceae bacterium]